MANTLFSKIKSLTKYKNLSYFNKAFTLKEILNENPLLIKLDSLLNKQNSVNTFILNSETETLQVTRGPNQFIIKKLLKEKNRRIETKLSLSGDYISQEKVFFHTNSKIPRLRERISKISEVFTHTIEQIKSDSKGQLVAFKLRQRKYQFGLEAGSQFPDPKVLDKSIFQNKQPPSSEHSRVKQKEIIIDTITKSPNIYNTPDDIKITKQTNFLDKLSDSDMSQYFEEIILFQNFLVLNRYGAEDYINSLIELIEKNKPSLMALNAADRYRRFSDNLSKRSYLLNLK